MKWLKRLVSFLYIVAPLVLIVEVFLPSDFAIAGSEGTWMTLAPLLIPVAVLFLVRGAQLFFKKSDPITTDSSLQTTNTERENKVGIWVLISNLFVTAPLFIAILFFTSQQTHLLPGPNPGSREGNIFELPFALINLSVAVYLLINVITKRRFSRIEIGIFILFCIAVLNVSIEAEGRYVRVHDYTVDFASVKTIAQEFLTIPLSAGSPLAPIVAFCGQTYMNLDPWSGNHMKNYCDITTVTPGTLLQHAQALQAEGFKNNQDQWYHDGSVREGSPDRAGDLSVLNAAHILADIERQCGTDASLQVVSRDDGTLSDVIFSLSGKIVYMQSNLTCSFDLYVNNQACSSNQRSFSPEVFSSQGTSVNICGKSYSENDLLGLMPFSSNGFIPTTFPSFSSNVTGEDPTVDTDTSAVNNEIPQNAFLKKYGDDFWNKGTLPPADLF